MTIETTFRKLKTMTPINGAFILHEDQKLLSFCSCDHLALADNTSVKKNAIKYVLQHGICPFAESGDFYLSLQHDIEKKLSDLLRRESALFFPSRSEANRAALTALGSQQEIILIDEMCHPSLKEGAIASSAFVIPYRQSRLETLLDEHKNSSIMIVSESVFSQDGSIASLPTLCELAEHYNAELYVDDSHALGIAGVDGLGLCAHLREIAIISGSLSKACGAYGGYIACSNAMRGSLIHQQSANSLLSPPILGAIEASLDLIPQMEGERKQLEQRSHWLRSALRDIGFDLPKCNTPLIGLKLKSPEECESLKAHLLQEQIVVSSCGNICKIALNVCHMPDHLTRLADAIKSWKNHVA